MLRIPSHSKICMIKWNLLQVWAATSMNIADGIGYFIKKISQKKIKLYKTLRKICSLKFEVQQYGRQVSKK